MDTAVLLERWDALSNWLWDALGREGLEGAVFQLLGKETAGAECLIRHAAGFPEHQQRKLAASLAGFLVQPTTNILGELLERETARDQAATRFADRLYSQSVVENIVFSASRWCRRAALRPAGLAVLRRVVEQTLAGQYWNTSAYAITTLCRYDLDGSAALLRAFHAYAHTATLEHPATTTLEQEQATTTALLAGDPQALTTIDDAITHLDAAAAREEFTPDSADAVLQLLAAARG